MRGGLCVVWCLHVQTRDYHLVISPTRFIQITNNYSLEQCARWPPALHIQLILLFRRDFYHLRSDHGKDGDDCNNEEGESSLNILALPDVETNSNKHTLWKCHGLLVMTVHQIFAWIFCLWWKSRTKKKGGDISRGRISGLGRRGESRASCLWVDCEVQNRKGAESGLEFFGRNFFAQRHVNYLDRWWSALPPNYESNNIARTMWAIWLIGMIR